MRVRTSLLPTRARAAEPFSKRHAEAPLGFVDELTGDVPIEHLGKDPLSSAVTNLHAHRQAPRELDHAVVDDWYARLQRDGQCSPGRPW